MLVLVTSSFFLTSTFFSAAKPMSISLVLKPDSHSVPSFSNYFHFYLQKGHWFAQTTLTGRTDSSSPST